jgi:hypothetical protein
MASASSARRCTIGHSLASSAFHKWPCPYPVANSVPYSLQVIAKHFAQIPEDEKNLMIRDNARRLYRL